MKQATFNGMDSIIETTKARKKKKEYKWEELPNGTTISLMKYLGLSSFGTITVDSPDLLYVIVGTEYRTGSGRRYYTLQPSVFNDSQYHLKQVEDSIKLIVWNEQKQKWQTREEYAGDNQEL